MPDDELAWTDEVVRDVVQGRSCLVHRHRRRHVPAILADVTRWADRNFLVQGCRRLTFGEFAAAVGQGAAVLRSAGFARGNRVMLLAANSPDWVVAFFAVLKAGGVVVSANAWWSREELVHAMAVSDPQLVLADRRRATLLSPDQRAMDISALTNAPAIGWSVPEFAVDEDDAAVLLFTSGTTGAPKASVLSHRSLIANQQNLLAATGRLPASLGDDHRGSVTLVCVPLFHMGGIQSVLSTLLTGGTIVFLEGGYDAGEVLKTIEREQVRVWGGVPTMVTRVLDHPDLVRRDTSSLATVTIAGTYVATDLLERVRVAFPSASRKAGTIYGMTEAGGTLTWAGGATEERPGTVGRPLPTAEIRIAEPDETGLGEIEAMSPALMQGYHNDATEQPFTADGWLRTGDLGRIDGEGYLYVVARSKDIIIRGGENIASPNVERALLSHPDVLEAAVVGLPDREFGEVVGAAVVCRPGVNVTVKDLTLHAESGLAYFEVPTRWWFCRALPSNATGKVVKSEIVAGWPSDGHPR